MNLPIKLEDPSWRKAVGILSMCLAAAVGMVVYEQRTAIFVTIAGSRLALLAVAVALLLVLVAAVAWLFVTQLDARTQEHVRALQDQIDTLKGELVQERADRERMLAQERAECERKLREARDYCDDQIKALLRGGA